MAEKTGDMGKMKSISLIALENPSSPQIKDCI